MLLALLCQFDNSVGIVLDKLKELGYYDNTMVWFTVDNGPEVNCKPEGAYQHTLTRFDTAATIPSSFLFLLTAGRCGSGSTGHIPPGTLHRPDCDGAGSAGPLRGRKRDVWEGGNRRCAR